MSFYHEITSFMTYSDNKNADQLANCQSLITPCFSWNDLSYCRGPPTGFGEQGNKGIYFRGTWEQRPNFEGNRETKTILGNREHRKQIFHFWGTREQANLFEGNKGTGTPPWEGLIASLKLAHVV